MSRIANSLLPLISSVMEKHYDIDYVDYLLDNFTERWVIKCLKLNLKKIAKANPKDIDACDCYTIINKFDNEYEGRVEELSDKERESFERVLWW